MAILDEMRMLAAERRLREQQNVAEKTNTKRDGKSSPIQGDLVCLRRLAQDEQRSHKLEARWEGPYKVSKVGSFGRSVWLQDLQTKQVRGRYHIDDVKIFLP